MIKNKLSFIQRTVQILSSLGINSSMEWIETGEVYSGPEKNFCLPVLNCHACPSARTTCPIGAMQSGFASHMEGFRWFPLYVLGILGIFMALVGRAPCAWLCPFGFLQDLLAKIRRKKIDIPRRMNYMRYVVLAVFVIILPFILRSNTFSQICPAGTLIAAIPWAFMSPPIAGLGWFFYLKIMLLGGTILLSIFSSRGFCRVFCPLGAILGAFNRWSLVNIHVDSGCTKCGACRKMCPMDIEIYKDTGSPDCIRCMACTKCKHVHVRVGYGEKSIAPSENDGSVAG